MALESYPRRFFERFHFPVWLKRRNNALQADNANLLRLLHSQKPRPLAFAAELGRWAAAP